MTEVNEPARVYTFGINVENASELDAISRQVRDFITVVGAGDCEIQVAVNPALTETNHEEKSPVMGFLATGGGAYIQEVDEDYDEEDEYYD